MIKLLIGGSPCTYWSIAQSHNRETTCEGQGWELFKNYLFAKDLFKPDFFLYENNCSASKEIKEEIEKSLDYKRIEFNSSFEDVFFIAKIKKRTVHIFGLIPSIFQIFPTCNYELCISLIVNAVILTDRKCVVHFN